jgi:hypothetical protein
VIGLLTTAPGSAMADTVGAPGGPGTLSHFDLARKDCLGTARNTTSKIWYTVADGVLSDVYAPTIDTTNVETMQYLVTDGSTFTDLQTRDMTYTVAADSTGMVCAVTATAKSGAYRLTSTYLTDPARDSVVVHAEYQPLTAAAARFRLYVRLDATVGGNGGGGAGNGGADSATIDTTTGSPVPVSYDTNTQTNAANRDYAVPSFLALRASPPFTAASSGFVGTANDGLTELDATHALDPSFTDATGGNVEQTAQLKLDKHGATTLAIGFGTTQAAAVATAGATVSKPFASLVGKYRSAWLRYDNALTPPSKKLLGLTATQRDARGPRILRLGERVESQRRQDVRWRDRGISCFAMGAVGERRRPEQHVFWLLPRGVLPRPLRGVDRAAHRRRPRHGTRCHPVPVPATATRRRLHAA